MRSGCGRPLSKTGKMIHFFNGKVFADNDKFNRKIFADVNQAPLPAIGRPDDVKAVKDAKFVFTEDK